MPIFVFYAASNSVGGFSPLAMIVAESLGSAAVKFREQYSYTGRVYIHEINHFDATQLQG